jgi:hypothetical protein
MPRGMLGFSQPKTTAIFQKRYSMLFEKKRLADARFKRNSTWREVVALYKGEANKPIKKNTDKLFDALSKFEKRCGGGEHK